jgi:cell division protein ZapB
MSTETDASFEAQLSQLFPQIEALINAYAASQAETQRLKTELADITSEHQALIKKTDEAKDRVEGMINRLKILEQR